MAAARFIPLGNGPGSAEVDGFDQTLIRDDLPANVGYPMDVSQPSAQLFFHGRNRDGDVVPWVKRMPLLPDDTRLSESCHAS